MCNVWDCEFLGFSSGVDEVSVLMGYDAASLDIGLPTFLDSVVVFVSQPDSLPTDAVPCAGGTDTNVLNCLLITLSFRPWKLLVIEGVGFHSVQYIV